MIELDEEEHPILSTLLNGKSWVDVYQLGMSMVDSAAVAATSPVLGTAGTLMLSGSSATQSMLDAVAKGATDEQALWMGAMSGAFEYLFEKYELENLLKNGSESVTRAFVAQALSEGFGEGATTIANFVADSLIMADKSELNRSITAYMEANPGMSEKEATKKSLLDIAVYIGWDTVGGIVSGSIMGSSFSVMNNAYTSGNKQTQTNLTQHVLTRSAETDGRMTVPTEKTYISMEDFAKQESSVWNNVDYNDDATKTSIMQNTHDAMVAEGAVVRVPDTIAKEVDQAYPDLRSMKKKDRTPILKATMINLKNDIRQFLNGFKDQSFEFEINGKVLEATLYNTGIKEVLEKVTKEKANMLYCTEDIFREARYLYSTPDYDGNSNIYRWNYFYTPVQIGGETVGVRIAVRDMAQGQNHLPESQIYNWGIKKDASLGGVQPVVSNSSHGASSDAPHTSLGRVRDDSDNRKPYQASSNVSINSISESGKNVNSTTTRQSTLLLPEIQQYLASLSDLSSLTGEQQHFLQRYQQQLQSTEALRTQVQSLQQRLEQRKAKGQSAGWLMPDQKRAASLGRLLQRRESTLRSMESSPLFHQLSDMLTPDPAPESPYDPQVDQTVENRREIDVVTNKKYGILNKISLRNIDIITNGTHLVKGKLQPAIFYRTGEHDYIYQTDNKSRICRAIASKLQLKTHKKRPSHARKTPGKLPGDEAGHLIADRFGGSRKLDNLVSQAKMVNREEFGRLERLWASALENGQEVSLDIRIFYSQKGTRPKKFRIVFSIDGKIRKKTIHNKQEVTNYG